MVKRGAGSWPDCSAEEVSELKPKSKKRFVGVRQRPSGRWVAEIKDTTQKIRLWLGTFDSAEEGAKAYDSAARALRGANTRTNFVTAIAACEGAVPAATSKAARLLRLRQVAGANAYACENLGHGANSVTASPLQLVRQDLNPQSISSDSHDRLPKHNPNAHNTQVPSPPSSSPLKPPRQIGRRNNLSPPPSSVLRPEDKGPELDTLTYTDSSLTILPQQSAITSENLSNAINYSLTPQNSNRVSSLSRLPLTDKCNHPTPSEEEHNHVQLGATEIHPKRNGDVDEGQISKKNRPNPPPPADSSRHMYSCSSDTRPDAPSLASHGDETADQRLALPGIDSSPAVMSFIDAAKASCKPEDVEISSDSLQFCDSTSGSFGKERGFGTNVTALDTIPWSDYILVDGQLDLVTASCETNCGAYASAFEFSPEAMDRDSCTSSAVAILDDHQAAHYLSDVDSTELIGLLNPLPLPPPSNSSNFSSSSSTDTECSSTEADPPPLWTVMAS